MAKLRLTKYKDIIEKTYAWGEKWLKALGHKHDLKFSFAYRNKKMISDEREGFSLACVSIESKKIHIHPLYFLLPEVDQEGTIKHELCHIVDLSRRTMRPNQYHDEEYQVILKTIDAPLSVKGPVGFKNQYSGKGRWWDVYGASVDISVAPNLEI